MTIRTLLTAEKNSSARNIVIFSSVAAHLPIFSSSLCMVFWSCRPPPLSLHFSHHSHRSLRSLAEYQQLAWVDCWKAYSSFYRYRLYRHFHTFSLSAQLCTQLTSSDCGLPPQPFHAPKPLQATRTSVNAALDALVVTGGTWCSW
jgi:hypothetical protein